MSRQTNTTRILTCLVLVAGVAVSAPAGTEEIARTTHLGSVADGPGKIDKIKLAKVKAAFLVNFLKFTKWPDGAFDNENSPNRVCIIGKSLVGKYLEIALKTAKVHGRSVLLERAEVPRRRQFGSEKEYQREIVQFRAQIAQCHMIYISQDDTTNINDLLFKTNLQSTLVIADDAKVLAMGGHLAFLVSDGHVSFSASVENIQKTELKVSSKLLRLAQHTQ